MLHTVLWTMLVMEILGCAAVVHRVGHPPTDKDTVAVGNVVVVLLLIAAAEIASGLSLHRVHGFLNLFLMLSLMWSWALGLLRAVRRIGKTVPGYTPSSAAWRLAWELPETAALVYLITAT